MITVLPLPFSQVRIVPASWPHTSDVPTIVFSPEGAVSSIKTFTSIPAEKPSHISSVGADNDISARSAISSFPLPPPVDFSTISESSSKSSRPRPRPIFRRTGPDPAPNASISDPILPHVSSSDHRDQFAIMSHSDPTVIRETTQNINPDLNNFSPDIAERAKMRARKATKRASQYADEEVIDITDDELAATPTRKLKKRVNLRPAKRATPVGNNLQLNSDPVTTPLPSSSPLLPLSDPFPESTLINSTPPRPHPPVEAAASGSPSQESPIQPRKRKRTVHLHSPIDNLSEPNCPPALPARVTTPRSNSLPPSEGVVDGVDLGQNLNPNKEGSEDEYDGTILPKKQKSAEKGSDSAAARPESSRVSKSKKKPTVMIVISPRKRKTESKQAKAKKKDGRNPERNDTESIKDRPPSSANPAEQAHRSVDDNDVHASLR